MINILLLILTDKLYSIHADGYLNFNTSSDVQLNYSNSTETEATLTDVIKEDYSIFDVCNVSQAFEQIAVRKKRFKSNWDNWFRTSTTTVGTTTDVFYNLSDDFLNCVTTTVEPECYQKLENGSVFVPLYNMVFSEGNFFIREDELFLCPDFFDDVQTLEDKFSRTISIVSIVGVSISTICIIFHIIMFILVRKMRNFPGYCLISLCIALLVAYICLFIQFQIPSQANCFLLGKIVYFSFLSSFFWMNVISFDVWQSILLATTKFRLSSERSVLVRFSFYSLYGWGTPLLIVIVAITADSLTDDERFKLMFSERTCWFKNRTALLIYFAVPLFIVLFVNVMFFASSFYMIHHSMMRRRSHGSKSGSDLRSRLFLALKLSTAMGLMWIFGVIATLTERSWLYYLYSGFNALQGVFIFFSFTVNDQTLKAIKNTTMKKKQSVVLETFPKLSFCNTVVQSSTESECK